MTDSVDILRADFEMRSNGDYRRTWSLTDKDTGASLLSAASDLRMQLKIHGAGPSDPAVIDLGIESDTDVTGICLDADVGTNGEFQVTILAASATDALGVANKITLDYDLVELEPGSPPTRIVYATGYWTIHKGVSNVS